MPSPKENISEYIKKKDRILTGKESRFPTPENSFRFLKKFIAIILIFLGSALLVSALISSGKLVIKETASGVCGIFYDGEKNSKSEALDWLCQRGSPEQKESAEDKKCKQKECEQDEKNYFVKAILRLTDKFLISLTIIFMGFNIFKQIAKFNLQKEDYKRKQEKYNKEFDEKDGLNNPDQPERDLPDDSIKVLDDNVLNMVVITLAMIFLVGSFDAGADANSFYKAAGFGVVIIAIAIFLVASWLREKK